MHDELEHLLSLYDRRAVTRRQLLQGLLVLGIAPHLRRNTGAALTTASEPVFRARTLNHVTLLTADVPRSKAFYQSLTGLPIRDEGKDFCEFRLEGGFLGLYTPDTGDQVGFNHFCFGIERYLLGIVTILLLGAPFCCHRFVRAPLLDKVKT